MNELSWLGYHRWGVVGRLSRTRCRRHASSSNLTSYFVDFCKNGLCDHVFLSYNILDEPSSWATMDGVSVDYLLKTIRRGHTVMKERHEKIVTSEPVWRVQSVCWALNQQSPRASQLWCRGCEFLATPNPTQVDELPSLSYPSQREFRDRRHLLTNYEREYQNE